MSRNLLSQDVMRALRSNVKKTDLEVVQDFMISAAGTVVLNEQQMALLNRMEIVDELFRSGKYNTRQIAEILSKKTGQSLTQSRRDVQDAETAFGATRRINKQHKIFRHFDRLEALYLKLQESGNFEMAIKVAAVMNKALELMPEDKEGARAPVTIVMTFNQASEQDLTDEDPVTDAEAEVIMSELLKEKGIVSNEA